MSARFCSVAILFYLCALVADLTYVVNGRCGFAFIPGRVEFFVAIILLLIGFELWAYRRFGTTMTRRTGVGLLVTRMVFVEMAVSLDCSAFSLFLYMLIIFLASFFLTRWISLTLAGLYYGWFLIMFTYFRCPGCGFDDLTSQIFMVGLAMLWTVVMAELVKAAETSRAQTQQLLVALEDSRQQLQSYAAQAWELATAEERNRLAREIHDSVGHYLAGVNIQLEKALTFHRRDPATSEQAMHDAKQAAHQALRDVRQSVRALRQTGEDFSLSTMLTDLVDRWRNGLLTVTLSIAGNEADYSEAVLMALYRVAQEGLTNIHKHAQANEVQIWLNFGTEKAHLRLCDNGQGFDQELRGPVAVNAGQRSDGYHYGLQGIQERVALLGGALVLDSDPGHGTCLLVTIPKAQLGERSDVEGGS